MYTTLIGSYTESFYEKQGIFDRCWNRIRPHANRVRPPDELFYDSEKTFTKQEMLRDIFIWSVYEGYADIALVLLLQIESRIGAALVAANIARRLSSAIGRSQLENRYEPQQNVYEQYATACIDGCFEKNQRLSCQLLTRAIPLFGNITCMQVSDKTACSSLAMNT